MYSKVTFLILLLRFPYKTGASSVCTPNSQTLLNGKVCTCNSTGQWAESGCHVIQRRQLCLPGQIVFQGCSRCVCQEKGQLSCTEDTSCSSPSRYQNIHETLATVLPWCSSFRTYYISCNICICPASGRSFEARCALDISCTFFKEPSTTEIASRKNTCIPKVMYLFPCLHCLCSDEGHFNLEKCVETCVRKSTEITRRCIPKTLYRKDCNVCLCPESSIPDDVLCTSSSCTHPTTYSVLHTLKNKPMQCTPHYFTKPKCIYCDCNHDGAVDDRTCLELECLHSNELKYNIMRETCSPGEMVPFCTECLCTRYGVTSNEYCSKACSYDGKIEVLDKVSNSSKTEYIIDVDTLKKYRIRETCNPGSIYIEQERYCLCPDTGNSNFNLCTSVDRHLVQRNNRSAANHVAIDFNVACEPSTFVEFDCNSCFCSKKGKIDPKWCTYDDCEAKRIIWESHASIVDPMTSATESPLNDHCNPGSISIADCNFCICPESGFMEERVCTKNECSTFTKPVTKDHFVCEPLAYYEVDCNVCYCPRDGIKNVVKCTKNHCEKNFLRSDVCVPGQLFGDECNVCVCPPNGNKAEKACTNYTCTDKAPWKKIFQLSESLLGNQIIEDATRNLDLCFPGEQFVTGCKLCVCPDMGLRIYATCSPTFCEEERQIDSVQDIGGSNRGMVIRKLNTRREDCMTTDVKDLVERKRVCTPGSMYIIRCQQCICPYMGDIYHFCRPLPENLHCEEMFPGVNYAVRRTHEENTTLSATELNNFTSQFKLAIGKRTFTNTSTLLHKVQHDHTHYECDKEGKISDNCFICECSGKTLIAEHCFQSNSTLCENSKPTFLQDYVNVGRRQDET